MMDRDLAELYNVSTKRLNEQVKRNNERFPEDFMFKLAKNEKDELVAKCDRFKTLKHSSSLPNVFTEHGALMLANVLKSHIAMEISILVVRAFIQIREILSTHAELQRKIDSMEKKYDAKFQVVFTAIKKLMEPPPDKPKRRIGF